MFNFSKLKNKSNFKILYISTGLRSGGAENILFNILNTNKKKYFHNISNRYWTLWRKNEMRRL